MSSSGVACLAANFIPPKTLETPDFPKGRFNYGNVYSKYRYPNIRAQYSWVPWICPELSGTRHQERCSWSAVSWMNPLDKFNCLPLDLAHRDLCRLHWSYPERSHNSWSCLLLNLVSHAFYIEEESVRFLPVNWMGVIVLEPHGILHSFPIWHRWTFHLKSLRTFD